MAFCMFQKKDTCSWKGQLEKVSSWKVRNEIGKNEVGAEELSNFDLYFPTLG